MTVFKRCTACHDVSASGARNRMGPELNGIVGRPAAAAEGFSYSKAMTDAAAGGLVWTPETLTPFLEDPRQNMPGNKMAFAGLKNPDDLADLVAYLQTLSEPTPPPPAP